MALDGGAHGGGDRPARDHAREVVEACVGRMHAVNGAINAVTVDLSERALADADRADARSSGGQSLGRSMACR